jgi:hypothetical protein
LRAGASYDLARLASGLLLHKKEIARNSYGSFDSVIAYQFVFVGDPLSSEEKEGSSLLVGGRKA